MRPGKKKEREEGRERERQKVAFHQLVHSHKVWIMSNTGVKYTILVSHTGSRGPSA